MYCDIRHRRFTYSIDRGGNCIGRCREEDLRVAGDGRRLSDRNPVHFYPRVGKEWFGAKSRAPNRRESIESRKNYDCC